MKKLMMILCGTFAAFMLSGCFGGASQAMRYYTMVLPEGKAVVEKPFAYRLFVKTATIDPAYRRNNIVYRESPYDFMFYNNSSWATRPEHLIEQSVAQRFEQSGIFQHVESALTAKPDFEFSIHVVALEEVIKPEGKFAHLTVQMGMRKPNGDSDLWAKRFDGSKEFADGDMRAFATIVSELLDGFTQEAVEEVLNVVETL